MSDPSRGLRFSHDLTVLGGGMAVLSVLMAVGGGYRQPWVGWGLAVAIAIAGQIVWFVRARRVGDPGRAVVGLLLMLPLLALISLGAFVVPATLRLVSGQIPQVALAEVGQRSEGVFHLKGAALRTELLGTRDFRYKHKRNQTQEWELHVVAPLVQEGWSTSSPVVAWAGCSIDVRHSIPVATAECLQTMNGVLELSEEAGKDYMPTIAIALKKHGLSQLDGAPVLEVAMSSQHGWITLAMLVFGLVLVMVGYAKLSRR